MTTPRVIRTLIVLFLCLFSGTIANAEPKLVYTDEWLDQRYDWVLYVEPKPAKHLMDHAGSKLRPVSMMKVSYRVHPRLAKGKPNKAAAYEDLYYAEARPIGCRRYGPLPFAENWQGAICFQEGNLRDVDRAALANAIVRLAIDVAAQKCTTAMIFLPSDMVLSVANEMHRFNFVRAGESAFGTPSALFLIITSGTEKDRQFLIFRRN